MCPDMRHYCFPASTITDGVGNDVSEMSSLSRDASFIIWTQSPPSSQIIVKRKLINMARLFFLDRLCKRRQSLQSSKTERTEETAAVSTRKVSFREARSIDTIHLTDYSNEEVEGTWYSSKDIKKMKAEANSTALELSMGMMSLNSDDPDDDPDHCARGLEPRMPYSSMKRDQTKAMAVQVVLDEQSLQQEDGIPHPEWIANAYAGVAKACRHEALGRARLDEEVIAVVVRLHPCFSKKVE